MNGDYVRYNEKEKIVHFKRDVCFDYDMIVKGKMKVVNTEIIVKEELQNVDITFKEFLSKFNDMYNNMIIMEDKYENLKNKVKSLRNQIEYLTNEIDRLNGDDSSNDEEEYSTEDSNRDDDDN